MLVLRAEFVCNRTETTSSGESRYGCFGPHLSSTTVFAHAKTYWINYINTLFVKQPQVRSSLLFTKLVIMHFLFGIIAPVRLYSMKESSCFGGFCVRMRAYLVGQ